VAEKSAGPPGASQRLFQLVESGLGRSVADDLMQTTKFPPISPPLLSLVTCASLELPVFSSLPAGGQSSQRNRPVNPHGPNQIPSENCRTALGWKRICALPEFSHHRETRFPLRRRHEGIPRARSNGFVTPPSSPTLGSRSKPTDDCR
jgi:hypothetical protein